MTYYYRMTNLVSHVISIVTVYYIVHNNCRFCNNIFVTLEVDYNTMKYYSSYEMKVFMQNLHLYIGLQNNKVL